jgi:hypothetical protein
MEPSPWNYHDMVIPGTPQALTRGVFKAHLTVTSYFGIAVLPCSGFQQAKSRNEQEIFVLIKHIACGEIQGEARFALSCLFLLLSLYRFSLSTTCNLQTCV